MQEQTITTRDTEQLIYLNEMLGMRPRILGKGGLKELDSPNFQQDLVYSYELYVNPSDLDLPRNQMSSLAHRIEGAHNLTYIMKDGRRIWWDLSNDGEEGDFWETSLEKTIDLVAAAGGNYVTTHLGEFQPGEIETIREAKTRDEAVTAYQSEKNKHILKAAERVTRLNAYARSKGIKLAIENDVHWVVTKYGAMLLNDPEAMDLFFTHVPASVGLVFDEEHAYRAAFFGPVWSDYLFEHIGSDDKMATARKFLKRRSEEVAAMGADNFNRNIIKPYVEEVLAKYGNRVIAVHDCGWDFRADESDVDQPDPGTSKEDAHLPPRRVISSVGDEEVTLRDLIDHEHTLRLIKATQQPAQFRRLKIVLEYARHISDKRKYRFYSHGSEPSTQDNPEEFAVAARSMRHIVSRLMQEKS